MSELLFGTDPCAQAGQSAPHDRTRSSGPRPHVAELIMDRPEALNALSTDQARRLSDGGGERGRRSGRSAW